MGGSAVVGICRRPSLFLVNLVSYHNKEKDVRIPGWGTDESFISPAVKSFKCVR